MPPPLEQMDLHDKAILWRWLRNDKHGNPVLAAAIEVNTRWEEGALEALDPKGEPILIDVQMAADRRIPSGSLMWEGSAVDLTNEPGTGSVPQGDIYEVMFRIRAKSLRGEFMRFEYALKRYNNALPNTQS